MDNLAGHKTRAFVEWLCAHGVLPLYTPLSGSWLNMTESVQRILIHRALKGHTPGSPQEIMTWLEQTARGWNADPTPSCGVDRATLAANVPTSAAIIWVAPVPAPSAPSVGAQLLSP